MPVDSVIVEKSGSKVTLTLNRPEAINALSLALLQSLDSALDEVEKDDQIKVIVLRGNGPRGFSSGLDRKEGSVREGEGREAFFKVFYGLMCRIDTFPKAVISLIHGHCIAAGAQLATAADIVIAADNLQLLEPELRGGAFAQEDWPRRLSRMLGPIKAKYYLFAGEPFTAQQALDLGLVSKVVPADELDATGDRLADQIAAYSPIGVPRVLRLVDEESGV